MGRVLRIAPDPFAQLGDFGLHGGHLRLERLHLLPQVDYDHLHSEWNMIPIFFRN
jgi:hypothetical protein